MIYVYVCPACGMAEEQIRKVAERNIRRPHCFICDRSMALDIQPVAGVVKNPAVPKRLS